MAKTDSTLPGMMILLDDETGLIVHGRNLGAPAATANKYAVGSLVTDSSTGTRYINIGTSAVPVWMNQSDAILTSVTNLVAADIVATTAGTLSHAQGLILVPAPGAASVLELVSCTVSFTFATAVYTGGVGNVTVNIGAGGAALTGLVSGANSFIKASSNINQFVPLSTTANSLTANTSLNLVSTAAFTQPGTAAGTAKITTAYRIHQV